MTLVHERDSEGDDFYRFGAATSSSAPENEGNPNKPKDQVTHGSAKDTKKSGRGEEGDGQEKTGDEG
jgi:H+-transporting ATPase